MDPWYSLMPFPIFIEMISCSDPAPARSSAIKCPHIFLHFRNTVSKSRCGSSGMTRDWIIKTDSTEAWQVRVTAFSWLMQCWPQWNLNTADPDADLYFIITVILTIYSFLLILQTLFSSLLIYRHTLTPVHHNWQYCRVQGFRLTVFIKMMIFSTFKTWHVLIFNQILWSDTSALWSVCIIELMARPLMPLFCWTVLPRLGGLLMLLHFAITSPDNSYCLGGTTIDEIKHKEA